MSPTLYRMKNLFSKLRSLYRVKNVFSNGDMLLLREVTWQNTKSLFINREQKMEMLTMSLSPNFLTLEVPYL